jgi:hypothetical protein
MKSCGRTVLWGAALAAGFVIPESATASVRWRADGNACVMPMHEHTASSTLGLTVHDSPSIDDVVVCPIPIGPQFVDLGDGSGHPLDKVEVRLRQESEAATIATYVIVHDYDFFNFCTCAAMSNSVPPNTWVSRSMGFDCGACSYADSWALNLGMWRRNSDGKTTIKLITAHD